MPRARRAVWTSLVFLFVVVAVFATSACSLVRGGIPRKALPAVSPLPKPTLSDWIVQIRPQGEVQNLAQIRVIFRDPLIPLQAIEDPAQQAKLGQFVIDPPLPGRFRFLTPRMVGFQQDEALPLATRVRVTLKAGLSDRSGHHLDRDLSWTFTTKPLAITNMPEPSSDQPVLSLNPKLRFTSNVELNEQSLADHVSLIATQTHNSVPIAVGLDTSNTPAPNDEDQPQLKYNAASRGWPYIVTPKQALAKDTRYELKVAEGLAPARGNLPSTQAFVGSIRTFGSLAFQGLDHDPSIVDRFEGGTPRLVFNNPLIADSVKKNLSLSPVPLSTAGLWQVSDGENKVTINTSWLTPTTKYTITVGPQITDTFGQTLDRQSQVALSTGDFTPNFWMPEGLNIFPADNDLQLNVSAVNLPNNVYSAAYGVVSPRDIVDHDSAYPDSGGAGLLPSMAVWPTIKVSAKKNQVLNIAVPLRDKIGGKTGMLAYGAIATTGRNSYDPHQSYYGLIELTNLGVFAQWFPNQGLVRVQHLSDGSHVAGAQIEIYGSPVARCATGTTDETGTFWLGSDAMQRCISGHLGSYGGPQLVAIAREGGDWAFARTVPWSGSYGYGIDSGWDNGAPQSRGAIFSDRQLYQPGEKASLTAAAYFLQNDVLHQDRNARYHVLLVAPDGTKRDLGVQTTDGFGSFSLELPLKANQALGWYSVRAKGQSGVEISGDFRVAQFKPPNFKVNLTLDREIAFAGDTVSAVASGEYLFGSPVQGGNASYYVTRAQTSFSPKGWDDFSFGRQWFWPEEPPTVASDVLQSKQTLSASGKFSQQVNVGTDIPYPMTYRVDAQVVDVSNLSVADSKAFTVLPSDALIGLRNEWVGNAGKPFPLHVIVTDPKGVPLARRSVKLELQQMRYSSATQIVEGGESQVNQIQYKTVASAQIDPADKPQDVSLTPPGSGPYRIRANFSDAKDDSSATDTQIWVTGPGEVDWGAFERDVLHIKLDKTTYRPGDVATALIQSPYPRAELFFAVIRNKVMYRTIATVSGGAPEIHFRVTRDMLPNAAVEAVLVRQGKPLRQMQPGSLASLARIGFAPFSINLDDKYLKVNVVPANAKLEPGSQQTVALHVHDAKGRPAPGEVAVMVVNETVLQLTGYRPPDLVQTIYAAQTIATSFADNRPDVVLQQIASPLQKGYGYGGGFLAGEAGTRVRTNFQPLAYYNGALHTDAGGNARFTFKLPDDLTTWRIMAVAVAAGASGTAQDFKFGDSDATFVTSKPLVTNPLLPQFARPGDIMQVGLSATNIAGGKGTIDVLGSLSGPLSFQRAGGASNSTTFAGAAQPGTQAFRFPLVATGVGTAHLTFKSALGSATDAFSIPLDVRNPLSVMESAIESGVTEASATIPVNIDPNVALDSGGLEVDLASTLLPEIIAPAMQTINANDLPFLEPAASRLLVSADLEVLSQRYGQSLAGFDAAASAAFALAQLQKLLQADGGFAWIPQSAGSDVFITPYAAESLAAAQSAGISVNPGLISGVKDFLKRKLADPEVCSGFEPCRSRIRLDILMALADLGEPRTDFLSDVYDVRDRFDLLGQVQLARYLTRFPAWQQQATAMAGKVQEIVYITGRSATINYPEEWGWLASPTAMRAQALRLFVARKSDPEFLDKLVTSLLALRRNGTWPNTYEDAEALTALIEYGNLQPEPPNFSAMTTFGGKTLQTVTFSGYKKTTDQQKVAMAEMPRGRNDLVVAKSGKGQLHYLVAYTYRLKGNQPGRLNGLRITREIREANQDKILAKMGLNAPNDSLTLSPGQIFDVGLEIISDHPIDHVVITDELPAGLEAVDSTFKTSTPYFEAMGDSWEIAYQTIYKDRVVAYGPRLEAGVYSMHYLVRSVTPGTYLWPAADVRLQYAPEEFGRTSTFTLIVSEK